jgi:hypothetical protein
MAFNFPNNPQISQVFTPVVDGPSWRWDGVAWQMLPNTAVKEAPLDHQLYGRKDATWVVMPDYSGGPFAPIASPVFTGNPQAPVAAAADNDLTIANTQWVNAAIAAAVVGAGSFPEVPNDSKLYARQQALGVGGWNDLADEFAGKSDLGHVHAIAEITGLVAELGLRAPIANPSFTGDPQTVTPPPTDNDASIANTAWVNQAIAAAVTAGGGFPEAPTDGKLYARKSAAWDDLSNDFAAIVHTHPMADITGLSAAIAGKADLNSPAFAGNPTGVTPPIGDNDLSLATTEFVTRALVPAIPNTLTPPDNATDWNSLITPGWQNKLYGPSSNANAPAPGYFFCLTIAYSSTNTTQIAIPYGANTGIGSFLFWRGLFGGVWSQWFRVERATAERRNRLMNPAMQVALQYPASPLMGLGYPAEQWSHNFSTTGTATVQRVQTVTPNKSVNRLQLKCTTIDSSLTGSEYWILLQKIEGVRVADLAWGTAAAKQVILRFGFKGPAGTWGFSLRNDAGTRSYCGSFVIAAGQAGTDTEQVFVIPGDTAAGVWETDYDAGVQLSITLAAAAGILGAAGWSAGSFLGATGISNGLAALNTFEIFDAGLHVDPDKTGLPPKWELPDEPTEQLACMRYWQQSYLYFSGSATSASTYYALCSLPAVPRAGVALSGTNGGVSSFPATVGPLTFIAPFSVREGRAASATAAAGVFATVITADARM